MTPVARNLSKTGLLLLICIALAGCASHKPPAAPKVQLTVDHFTGSALSGPATRPADAGDASAAIWVDVRLLALPNDYLATMAPIGPRVRLITASRGGMPILAAGQLTRGTRWADGGAVADIESQFNAAGESAARVVGASKLAVPRAVSAVINIEDNRDPAGDLRKVQIYFHQPATGPAALELTIGIADDTFSSSDSADEPAPTTRPAKSAGFARELAVLQDLPIDDSTAAAILIPFSFSDGIHHSVLVLMHASRGQSGSEIDVALARCAADLKRSADIARSQPSISTLVIADTSGFDAALAAIRKPATRRPSLAYLAGQSGAIVCEDVTLIATDETLDQLTTDIFKLLETVKTPYTAESLGWAMDVATLHYLGRLQSANKLSDELLSVLLRHTGQVGANSGSIDDIVKAVGNRKDLLARLTADNFVYLEDNSPSARVRAYDWLNARGDAPPGYDPLAPPRQRHDALQKAYDAMAAKSVPQGGRP